MKGAALSIAGAVDGAFASFVRGEDAASFYDFARLKPVETHNSVCADVARTAIKQAIVQAKHRAAMIRKRHATNVREKQIGESIRHGNHQSDWGASMAKRSHAIMAHARDTMRADHWGSCGPEGQKPPSIKSGAPPPPTAAAST